MSEEGYARSYRRKWKSPVFRNLRDAGIWAWMTDSAAWRPTTTRFCDRLVPLERGQIVTSERFIAEGFCVDRSVVRRLLDTLENEQMITRQKAHGGTIITICNYDKFQAPAAAESPAEDPRSTHGQPTSPPPERPAEDPAVNAVTDWHSIENRGSGGATNPPGNPRPTHATGGERPNKNEGKNIIDVGDTREPGVDLIADFDAERVEAFGSSMARPWPAATDLSIARRWLEAGADRSLCRSVFRAKFLEQAASRDPPANSLKFMDHAVFAALRAKDKPEPERTYGKRTEHRNGWAEAIAEGGV